MPERLRPGESIAAQEQGEQPLLGEEHLLGEDKDDRDEQQASKGGRQRTAKDGERRDEQAILPLG